MDDRTPHPEGRPQARRPKRKRKLLPLYLLLIVIAALLAVVIAFLPREGRPPVRLPELNNESLQPPSAEPGATENPAPGLPRLPQLPGSTSPGNAVPLLPEVGNGTSSSQPVAFRRPASRGTLIFVIDDVGNNVDELQPFLKFPGPLTLSVMPQRPYTLESYDLILAAGKVPILHQPMEADGKQNPGPGAIYTTMSKQEIDALLTRNLAGMPEIRWMNNHEGSKATSDIHTMTDVISYLKAHGMHFLDSRTTKATVVKQADQRLGLPYFHRNSYFLDDTVSKANIEKEIAVGLRVAQRQGYAVMVGHVWDRELPSILIRLYPRLRAEGYQFADIRSLTKEVHLNVGTGN